MSTKTILPHGRNPYAHTLASEAYTLAKQVAKQASRKWPSFDPDEIESAAMLGAWEAARNWSPQRAVKFQSFAYHRISGAIKDVARAEQVKGYRRNGGRKPEGAPKVVRLAVRCRSVDLYGHEQEYEAPSSSLAVVDEAYELHETIEDLIRYLPRQHRAVMRLLYGHAETCTMAAAGRKLGISESRVSQVHTESVAMIRQRLGVGVREKETVAS